MIIIFSNILISYDYPDDPYVLVGSCQVIISLSSDSYFNSNNDGGGGYSYIIVGFILLGICYFMIFSITVCSSIFRSSSLSSSSYPNQSPQYIPVATSIDPSNTYPSAPPLPINPTPTYPSNYGYNSGNTTNSNGFWSGMGTGGLLGYMIGRNSRSSSWGSRWGGGYRNHHYSPSNHSISMTRQTGFARTQRR